jgi:predicted O-methyltransferase YrrM
MRAKKLKKIEDYVNLIYNSFQRFPARTLGWGIDPVQVKEEIVTLARIVEKKRPYIVMEIGTAGGGTLLLWTRASREDAIIISIDLPEGKFGGGYSKKRIPYYRSFAVKQQQLNLIRGDSHNYQVCEYLKGLYGKNIDFSFIDGDHTYEGVKDDFEMYTPLVKSGGLVAFHDIVPGQSELAGEVSKFWLEIRDKYNHFEIVRDWNQGGYGIGILCM